MSVFIDRFYLSSVNQEIYHTNQIDLSNSETSVDYIEKFCFELNVLLFFNKLIKCFLIYLPLRNLENYT